MRVRVLASLLCLAPLALAAAGRAEDTAPRVHTVAAGESLWQIAADEIGDPTLWPALYHANRDQIKDPERVYPGQRLAIPEIDPERRDALRREARDLQGP